MSQWLGRGINTVVIRPEGDTNEVWDATAVEMGLKRIRKPGAHLVAEAMDPDLLAWALTDEPSGTHDNFGKVTAEPDDLIKEAEAARMAAAMAGVRKPFWLNHLGNHLTAHFGRQELVVDRNYFEHGIADWLASDTYQIQENKRLLLVPEVGFGSSDDYVSTHQGVAMDRLRAWSGTKPTLQVIGSSRVFQDSRPYPTVEQFAAQFWSSIIHGATGIIYFGILESPWSFDDTHPDIAAAMPGLYSDLLVLESILLDTTNGGRRPFVILRSAKDGAIPKTDQLPYPFEACAITTTDGIYRIILNLSEEEQVLTYAPWELVNVPFAGLQCRRGYVTSYKASEQQPL